MYLYRCLLFVGLISITARAQSEVDFWDLSHTQASKHSLQFQKDMVVWTDELRPGLSEVQVLRIVGLVPTDRPFDAEFKDLVGETIDSGMAFEVEAEDETDRRLFFVFTGVSGQRHLVQQLDKKRFAFLGTTADQECDQILTAPIISTLVH